MAKRKIWIVNFHATPPEYSFNSRYLDLTPYLEIAGYDVTIVSTGYLRKFKKFLTEPGKTYIEKEYNGIKFIHIKPISYTGNGLRRMLAMLVFSVRLLLLRNKFDKPDIIYHNLHVPFDIPVYFASRKLGAKYIAEVWDLWPEFFHRMGLISRRNPLMWFSYKIEKWIYHKSDGIVYTMPGWPDYIKQKNWDQKKPFTVNTDKAIHITNGIDLQSFDKNASAYKISDTDLEDENSFKVLYVGSIKKANNVKKFIEAANYLKNNSDIKFIIFGDGEDRDKLEEYSKTLGLKNVIFKQKQLPIEYIPYILTNSSLNIMNYQEGFGDFGISSGKLPLYLASARPIVSNVRVNYCLITKNNIGISERFANAADYADAIKKIKETDKNTYDGMCKRARLLSKEFDYNTLAKRLIDFFDQTTKTL